MPKGSYQPHIYLLLQFGIKPKELIEMGYNRHTAYAYSRRFAKVKENYNTDLERLLIIRNSKRGEKQHGF